MDRAHIRKVERRVAVQLNIDALIAVILLAGVLLIVFGILYVGASRSHALGELNIEGVRLLRWALIGYAVIYGLLLVTTILA